MWLNKIYTNLELHCVFIRNLKFIRKHSIIASVLSNPQIGEITEVKGWVKSIRKQKEYTFIDIRDGSCSERLQIVIPYTLKPDILTYDSALAVTGKVSRTPKGQIEIAAENVKLLGECIRDNGYPFNQRSVHSPDYLRQYLHLRPRSNYISAILRVRSALTKHIHDYFYSKNYLHIHTPILTSNDCEGAGEVFKVEPDNHHIINAMMQKGGNSETAFFGTKSYLTVSAQLQLEATCRAIGNVYTLGPTFRAENSKSRFHLSEFYMLEAEIAFCDTIKKMQEMIEDFLKYVFQEIRNTNEADLFLIDKMNQTPSWLNKKFITLTYEEANTLLEKKGQHVNDEGINKEQELMLVEFCQNTPIFIVEWPKSLKAFYMKESQTDNSKVDALDLLAPTIGEILGGSLREDDYEKLKNKVPTNGLEWYLELRRFGNIPTGGFGLGLERLMQVVCCVPNIRDTIAFPRWPHHCAM